MNYHVDYHPLAKKDLLDLDGSQAKIVLASINKVSQNPLPKNEGGYGEALGNKHGINLTGCCKIKLKKLGIRVVYKLIRTGKIMRIIVIAARADEQVYDMASKRV